MKKKKNENLRITKAHKAGRAETVKQAPGLHVTIARTESLPLVNRPAS
jgi:hypothetical protein